MGLTLAVAEPLRHDPERLRASARDLLARPPFSSEDPGPVTDVLLRLRAWLAAALEAVLETVVGNQGLAWTVVLVATAAVLLLVLRWGRHVRREPSVATPADGPSQRSAGAWLVEAERHADSAHWVAAIRCAYVALVTQLAEQGLLEASRGLTVGEIDRLVAVSAPARAAAVAEAGRAFEDAWYGHRRADRGGFQAVLAAIEPVSAGLRS